MEGLQWLKGKRLTVKTEALSGKCLDIDRRVDALVEEDAVTPPAWDFFLSCSQRCSDVTGDSSDSEVSPIH